MNALNQRLRLCSQTREVLKTSRVWSGFGKLTNGTVIGHKDQDSPATKATMLKSRKKNRDVSLIPFLLIGGVVALIFGSGYLLLRQIGKSSPANRVLFIGNSFTSINGGLDQQLESFSFSIGTSRIDNGGYTLEKHWNEGKALQAIRQGGWGYVVLQEQSQTPITDQKKFYEFVRKFDAEIKRNGAKTVLLMTWQRPDSVQYGVTTANLAAAYQSIGAELGAKVSPAGLAFARSLQGRPDLALYIQDGHPTQNGTYLATCVLYTTIFAQSLLGNPNGDMGIDAKTREYFQRVAAETLGAK